MDASIDRREFLERAGAAIGVAGALGAQASRADAAIPETVTVPEKFTDVVVPLRNWFVNRCPMLTRLNWRPTEYGCQLFRYPVASDAWKPMPAQAIPGGIQTPYDFGRTMQLQNLVDDVEGSIYWGPGTGGKMSGLRKLIKTNHTIAPAALEGYGPDDFIRDTYRAAIRGGGKPDLLFVAANTWSKFGDWKWDIARVDCGETAFGTKIDLMESPRVLPGVSIIEAPLLGPFTAIALQADEVYVRNKVNPHWVETSPDAGEWVAELAIELINEPHAAWLEAIA